MIVTGVRGRNWCRAARMHRSRFAQPTSRAGGCWNGKSAELFRDCHEVTVRSDGATSAVSVPQSVQRCSRVGYRFSVRLELTNVNRTIARIRSDPPSVEIRAYFSRRLVVVDLAHVTRCHDGLSSLLRSARGAKKFVVLKFSNHSRATAGQQLSKSQVSVVFVALKEK